MRRVSYLSVMLLISFAGFAQVTPERVVEDQVKAYNQKDLSLFCSFYREDIKYYDLGKDFTTQVFIDGQAALKERFQNIFRNNPGIQCEIVDKTVLGNKVILKEKFTGTANGARMEFVFIYVVVDNKITAVMRIKND